MSQRVTATVDLAAIRHNLQQVRRYAPQSRVMAAIKADAYGHGAVPVARALLNHADSFGVACMQEALILREAHIRAPLVLLEGILSQEEARLALRHDLQIVLHDDWQFEILEALPQGARISLWLKLDSGMHRLGFPLAKAAGLWQRIQRRPEWDFRGWMTHLACADETGNPASARQIAAFGNALKDIPGARSIANSAGLIAWPDSRADWVRPGLMLYGASPFPDKTAAELGLKPAMKLESRLITVHQFAKGEGIGYSAPYHCPEDMPVGVVAAGYGDGIRRGTPIGTPVIINGQRVPLIGRVSMDMITVDLRLAPQAKAGDSVLLWGEGLPAEEIASHVGTLAYELFCGLTQRVSFVHVDPRDV